MKSYVAVLFFLGLVAVSMGVAVVAPSAYGYSYGLPGYGAVSVRSYSAPVVASYGAYGAYPYGYSGLYGAYGAYGAYPYGGLLLKK